MYGPPYMGLTRTAECQDTIVVCGFCPRDLRRCAEGECRRLGKADWQVVGETISPKMVTLGGRVRLWEGRYEVARV